VAADPSTGERRFECTGCGRCCTGNDAEHYVALGPGEEAALAELLGLAQAELRARHLVRLGARQWGIRLEDGACTFLDAEGRCDVYAARPLQCASYPFWPELLASDRAWDEEAARCEGIGRGEPVELDVLGKWLSALRAAGV